MRFIFQDIVVTLIIIGIWFFYFMTKNNPKHMILFFPIAVSISTIGYIIIRIREIKEEKSKKKDG